MDEIDRTFQTLLRNIRKSWPQNLTGSFPVEDLYQTIIPYRHNRQAMGLETNQEYEFALMRLLSGEGGYLRGDHRMQTRLADELKSSNPDLSLFREYGAEKISLAPGAADGRPAGSPSQDEAAPPPAPPRRKAPQPAAARREEPRKPAPPPPPPPAPVPEPVAPAAPPFNREHMSPQQRTTTAEEQGGNCRYCAGKLPDGRAITFCPHCGQDLTVQQCPACGTELELGWKFCTTCGRSVADE